MSDEKELPDYSDDLSDVSARELIAELNANFEVLNATILAIRELLIEKKVFSDVEFMERLAFVLQRETNAPPE
jgi:hypothetical protein